MKQLNRLLFAALLATAALAQAQNRVMQVYSGGSVVYEISTARIDSVTFASSDTHATTNVLMLTTDFTTNIFESGYEFIFDKPAETFTISPLYQSPGDFGGIELYFSEIDKLLFSGTIFWMGNGSVQYPKPEKWLSAEDFDKTVYLNYVSPKNGFEEVLKDDYDEGYFKYLNETEIEAIWGAVQPLVKAREYIEKNPEQKVKMYLYTPTVGDTDWTVAKWVIFLYK